MPGESLQIGILRVNALLPGGDRSVKAGHRPVDA
jgi:hypothetical protein